MDDLDKVIESFEANIEELSKKKKQLENWGLDWKKRKEEAELNTQALAVTMRMILKDKNTKISVNAYFERLDKNQNLIRQGVGIDDIAKKFN